MPLQFVLFMVENFDKLMIVFKMQIPQRNSWAISFFINVQNVTEMIN